RAADRIRRLVPDARLWLVAGTGHAPHLERPDELAEVIVRAFGEGGALPADDEVVIPEGTAPAMPWKLNELPYIERAIGRALARAVGGGGALPADGEADIPEGTAPAMPWKLNELPYIERALGRALARRSPADAATVAFWLAQSELAVGDLAGAEQAIAPLAA